MGSKQARMSRLGPGLLAGITAVAAASGASGETLAEALALAYQNNPTLQSERAQLRALDETFVQARTGLGPQLSATLEADYAKGALVQNGVVGASGPDGADAALLNLIQPLFTGGQTSAEMRAAMSDILAERQKLRQTEANVLESVVQAYVDVRRDAQALVIARDNLALLQRQLVDTQAHVDVGEYTRTDLAQAQARLAGARSQLANARSQLAVSRGGYLTLVGQNPGNLAPEPPLPNLPKTLDQALDVAARTNPSIAAADFAERAAAARVALAKAAWRPTITVRAAYGVNGVIGPLNQNGNQATRRYEEQATAAIVLTQPLFTAGLNESKVRQALENDNTQLIALDLARRQAVQSVSQAWSRLRAAEDVTASSADQVAADEVAYEGVKLDTDAGERTTLDELNAEQELQLARLALNSARHDAYVAQASLLGAMGLLEMRNLAPEQPRYEPERSFEKVRNAGAAPWEGVLSGLDSLGRPMDPRRGPLAPAVLPKPAPDEQP